jgi:RNA polymerase sigma-70 factor (ECF subfamily)
LADDPKGLTKLLREWAAGQAGALDQLVPLMQPELRRIAAGYLKRERPGHTLQATALVNEAYVRIIDSGEVTWKDRAHFLAVAAKIMRRILVDHARARRARKRGGSESLLTFNEETDSPSDEQDVDVIALHEVLERLATFDPRQERIVELRCFGGMTVKEIGEVLKISPATVKREWTTAKAWLYRELND